MERRGLKTMVYGRGKVKSQSIAAGTAVKAGSICELRLEI
jgi:cell division protein FtsI (penicillin-binding protein 3)